MSRLLSPFNRAIGSCAVAVTALLVACDLPTQATSAGLDQDLLTEAPVVAGTPSPNRFRNVMSMCVILHPEDPFNETPPFPIFMDGPWMCMPGAGTLVTPRVAITAAHFKPFFDAFPPQAISLQLGPSYDSQARKVLASYHTNPAWDPANPAPNDVGVFVLEEPLRDRRLARLPRFIGEADRLRPERSRLRLVDFGNTTSSWPPVWGTRTTGVTTVVGVEPGYISVAPRPGGESVGCFGNSGSPAMRLGGQMRILAVGSSGSGDCLNGEWYARLDTPEVVAFLSDYLPRRLLPKRRRHW